MLEGLSSQQINSIYPVVGMTVYPRTWVIHRCSTVTFHQTKSHLGGGMITRLSRRSLNNFIFRVSNYAGEWLSLLTLTYGQNYPLEGRRIKDDWNAFVLSMRRNFGPFEYFWFLEFQDRGAPHLHVCLSIGPPCDADREIMADLWARIAERYNFPFTRCRWQQGVLCPVSEEGTRDPVRRNHKRRAVWEGIRERDGAIRYVVSYATKPRQKEVPKEYRNVGRFWATSRGVKLPEGMTMGATEAQIREILGYVRPDMEKWEVLPKIIHI